MAAIPGVSLTVLQNGTPVDFKSVTYTRDATKVSPSWSIEFPSPIDIADTDLWTIKKGFAGYEQTLIDSCLGYTITGSDGVSGAARSVSREADQLTESVLEYCVPKTLAFVNPDWLLAWYPSATLKDKIIKIGNSRLYHPRLPDKAFQDTDFECILSCKTHQDVARYLCGLIGFNFVCEVPNVTILDTFTVATGTEWFEAIKTNFLMWGAAISVSPATPGHLPTIHVLDLLANADDTDVVVGDSYQSLVLDNPAIVSVEFSRLTKKQFVDHVIVTGRKTNNTTFLPSEDPDFTTVELPEVPLSDDLTVATHGDLSGNAKFKTLSEYTGNFGTPDDYYVVEHASQAYQTTHYHRERTGAVTKYTPLTDETLIYDGANQLVGKTENVYKYGPGKKIIRTIEKEYLYCPFPGSDQYDMRLLRVKTTCQDQFVRSLNLTLTSEFIEEVVLYYEEVIDGKTYKTNPMPMLDAIKNDPSRSAIDKDPNTKQKTLEMTTHWRKTFISRTDDSVLIKRDIDYSPLTGAQKVQSQILDNPMRYEKRKDPDHVYRKEFFNVKYQGKYFGSYGPCYHKPRTVNHDDISTDDLALKLANRAFAYEVLLSNHITTVKVPVPIPLDTTLLRVTLPDFTWMLNGEEVTVPGGVHFLKQIKETFGFEGEGSTAELKYEQILTLRMKPTL